jgi:hypothetical protein
VDYSSGKVVLTDFSPSSFEGKELKINAVPYYKDAEPSQNEINLIADSRINVISAKNRKLLTSDMAETKGDITTLYETPIGTELYV